MTPSDKPERSDSSPKQQEANQTSVITESTGARTDQPSATPSTDGEGEAKSSQATDDATSSGSSDSTGTASSNTDETGADGTETPPPWQRGSAASSGTGTATASSGAFAGTEDTQTIPKAAADPETVRTEVPQQSGQDGRTAINFGSGSRSNASGTATGARRPSRGPRRASLQIKRVDPWSVLKLALVLSVAMFFVWMIAVAVLYGVLDGMGVWDQLNGTFSDLTQPEDAASDPLISAGRVFGVASIIGAINIVLFTALATVSAFIYNVAADFAGGVEVTLSERE